MTRSSIYRDRDKDYAATEDRTGLTYEQLAARWEQHMVALYGRKLWNNVDATADKEGEDHVEY